MVAALLNEYDRFTDVATMMLSELLRGITVTKMFQTLYGRMVVTHDVQVNRLAYDSRTVGRGDCFIALRGVDIDGHTFIANAVANGASVVVLEDDAAMPDSYFMHAGVVKVVVPNTRIALALMAATVSGNPTSHLTIVGVTGTNGKTTTTHLIRSILGAHGAKAGLIGTIEYNIGDVVIPATHTTPESLELQQLLRRMVDEKCSAAVMEVSSHSLTQHRVDGVRFAVAVFTNLTQDHLDYHGSMESYFSAKRLLFEHLDPQAVAVINIDDPWGIRMQTATQSRTISYGTTDAADVCASDVSLTMSGTNFTVRYQGISTLMESPLIGRFNVSNMLASIATGIALDIPMETMRTALRSSQIVRGRFERIVTPAGWAAVIDYAHTPDALHKALTAVRDIFDEAHRGRIITVFGCGGNRDKAKRPQMGRIATELSDCTIVTSDNPRKEDPESIIREVAGGAVAGSQVECIADRRTAILKAFSLAQKDDVVLIAGKGHEEYQVIGETRHHFSDREIVEEYVRSAQ